MAQPCKLPIEQLKAIPFCNATALTPARQLSCLRFYLKGEWHCWLEAKDTLHKMRMLPVEVDYFGDTSEQLR